MAPIKKSMINTLILMFIIRN